MNASTTGARARDHASVSTDPRQARGEFLGDLQMALTLRGDRNQCAGCREYFNSSAAFDKHRTGGFGSAVGDGTYMAHTRRCRTVAEMEAAGMAKNRDGWWITAPNPMDYPMHNNIERPYGWELVG